MPKEFGPESQARVAPTVGNKDEKLANPGRRRFLRDLGLFGILAAGGCTGVGKSMRLVESMVGKREHKETKPVSFSEQWKQAFAEGVRRMENDRELTIQLKEYTTQSVTELAEVFREFDIQGYLEREAALAGIRPEQITGHIDQVAIGCAEPFQNVPAGRISDEVNLEIFFRRESFVNGRLDRIGIEAMLRHEAAHFFSFDYQAPPGNRIPWLFDKQQPEKFGMSFPLYEGMTELVAMQGRTKDEASKHHAHATPGGPTFTAFFLSALIGRSEFVRAYLTKDPKKFQSLLDAQLGVGATHTLFNSLVPIQHDVFDRRVQLFPEVIQLEVLHRLGTILAQAKRAEVATLNRQAWEFGIPEQIAFHSEKGLQASWFLAYDSSNEKSCFSFRGIVEAPPVARFGKPKNQQGEIITERPMLEFVKFYIRDDQKSMAEGSATVLKRACENPDPASRGTEFPIGSIDIDEYIESRLEKLSQGWKEHGWQPGMPEFDLVWDQIQQIAIEASKKFIDTWYTLAGVKDLVVPTE